MPLDLDTREQLLSSLRRFVAERLHPIEGEIAEKDEIPDSIVAEMRALGLFGLSIPIEYGGLGLMFEEECLVAFEMGRTSPAFRSVFGTNVGIGSQGLVMYGTDEQKSRWLPDIASGKLITSFALTEAEAGSDAANLKLRARPESDTYRLSGQKIFITNADKAGLFTVMARTGGEGAAGISAFLVPRDLPGLTVGRPERKMGQQGAHVCTVTFDEVCVPAAHLLGSEGEGFKLAMRVLDRGRLHISAICVGIAERLIADIVAFAQQRRQFGQALSQLQLIQAMIADSKTETLAARALTLDVARQRDRGDNVTLGAAAAKYFASEMVGRVADRAVQIFGGAGYVADQGIERFYRDVRLFRIYEGTSQIQQIVIARETVKAGE
ncbi:acyl-CoA dehydrogenase family protein [Rhizorhabdus wittichii]|uniref:acyl-CoA dehydrogenase family protein n=1 Tax=Rhizorhabdus wittichii TaxID=160791 RepID=UPI0002F11F93|nr:acyl-CoA dehydrogenase family protein [Rhizorhabdus wittichii]